MSPQQHAVAERTVLEMVDRTRTLLAQGPGIPLDAVASAVQEGLLAAAPHGPALVDYLAALAAVACVALAAREL